MNVNIDVYIIHVLNVFFQINNYDLHIILATALFIVMFGIGNFILLFWWNGLAKNHEIIDFTNSFGFAVHLDWSR
jgi:hypothetical protein